LALFLPHGTSAALVQKLNSATVATIDTPVVQVRIQEIGADQVRARLSLAELSAKIRGE